MKSSLAHILAITVCYLSFSAAAGSLVGDKCSSKLFDGDQAAIGENETSLSGDSLLLSEGCFCDPENLAYVDVLIAYNPEGSIGSNGNDPTDIFGPPANNQYVSLGQGGSIVVGFTGTFLTNSGDANSDILIYEEGPDQEGVRVLVRPASPYTLSIISGQIAESTQFEGFYELGLFVGNPNPEGVDLDQILDDQIAGSLLFDQILLLDDDDGSSNGSSTPGADVSGVAALCTSNTPIFPGCTDPLACNFVAEADFDDGLCSFPSCSDPIACNYDIQSQCGDNALLCDYPGCTYSFACNYDPNANCDDGTCDFSSCAGCAYVAAINYMPTALIDDGSCMFQSFENTCPEDLTGDGFIDTSDLLSLIAAFGTACP